MFWKLIVFIALISRTSCWIFNGKRQCDEKATSIDISAGLRRGDVIYYNGVKYKKGEHYYDNNTETERGCICLKETCVKKCCTTGYGYDVKLKSCVPLSEEFDPPIWDDYMRLKDEHASQVFHLIHDVIDCTKFMNNDTEITRLRISKLSENFHLQKDGQLYIELPDEIPPHSLQSPERYCVDTFVIEDEEGHRSTRLDALVCLFADHEDEHNYLLSSVCMLISCAFILVTLGVYAWLPELQNLYGKVLMAYLACLLASFLMLATMQLKMHINDITSSFCLVMTFIIYFSLLSSFFWLNVMCFDIYWTFSGKRGLSLEKLSSRDRFLAYAVYAFGVPTLLTILLAGLEFSGLPVHYLMPGIKHHGCFLHGTRKLLYLYGPILVLCVANMAFFALTAFRIASVSKQTAVLHSQESATHDQQRKDRQRLVLYLKLFSVMGISWILEVAAALYPEAQTIWQFTDSYNVLIGVIIFIIFVCKRKIFRLIKKRYKQMRGDSMSRSQTSTSRTYTSREDHRASTRINGY